MPPSSILSINRLPYEEKRKIYARIIPPELLDRFGIDSDLTDADGHDLIDIQAPKGSATAEMSLYHRFGFRDPLLYGQIQDTLNVQFHILLYILNDPDTPRFDVDRLPNGVPTQLGVVHRNIEAEVAAMRAGLAPGQVRTGLGLLKEAIHSFEGFVASAGHDLYFAEPLYYHNAIIFERHGLAYQQGRKLMERIQQGFSPGGVLMERLDESTPFRRPEAAGSIRLRSWAIHDGILNEPFTNVTMYKRLDSPAGITTCPGCDW